MGCDIHLFVERKRRPTSPWTLVDQERAWAECWAIKNQDQIKHLPMKERLKAADTINRLSPAQHEWDTPVRQWWPRHRNYRLFALLADVRNDDGIYRVEPLAAPRGVPDDVSKGYAKEVKDYGQDGHSHSFFTVAELLAFGPTSERRACSRRRGLPRCDRAYRPA